MSGNECGKAMTLSIAPNKFTQSDFTVFYTAPDGRKLSVGRIFKATVAPPLNYCTAACVPTVEFFAYPDVGSDQFAVGMRGATWWRFHLANDAGDPANFSLNKRVDRWISLQ